MSLPNNYECEGQMSIFDILSQDGWSGKTSAGRSVPPEERTSILYLKKRRESQTKPPLFLDLRENGIIRGAFWATDGLSLGEYTTRSFGEYPNVEKESRLSQILEETPPQKYYLTPKACQGILRRAAHRGKDLPRQLKEALIQQATRLKYEGGVAIDSKGKKAGKGALIQTELSGTLGATQDQTLFKFDKPPLYTIGHDLRASQFTEDEKTDPLTATDYKDPIKLNIGSVVRRLTPLECERLQGYPDGWTDIGDWVDSKGKKHRDSDSPRYKAIGNSIALPFWEWMAHKMVNQIDPPATMASLFDGIGGFPLVFSRCGVDPVWASEVEEFPIAVTKKRFPE